MLHRMSARRVYERLAAAVGDTPLFVYDSAMLTARVAEWRAAMPAEVQLHYAMKANPYGPLLGHMAMMVDGLDVASGGELSRVRLGLEVVLAAGDPGHIFVFDEVDAGIGGSVAIEVGRRLARLAEYLLAPRGLRGVSA